MTLPGTALSPAQLRRLAVGMVEEDGDAPDAVAAFLEVSERSVWRWLAAWRRRGDVGLLTRPGQGRPPKLTGRQERQVLGWLGKSACKFGFLTERWTAPRVAALMAERLGVQMNRRYLSAWLPAAASVRRCPNRSHANATTRRSAGGSPVSGR